MREGRQAQLAGPASMPCYLVHQSAVASSLWLERIGAQRRHYNPNLGRQLNPHFPVRAGNPDLFRPRLAGGFHRALHDVAHLGEPPAGAGDAPPLPRRVGAPTLAVGVETEFQLVVCRVCHNEPFFARHSRRRGWTNAVQGKIYPGLYISQTQKPHENPQ